MCKRFKYQHFSRPWVWAFEDEDARGHLQSQDILIFVHKWTKCDKTRVNMRSKYIVFMKLKYSVYGKHVNRRNLDKKKAFSLYCTPWRLIWCTIVYWMGCLSTNNMFDWFCNLSLVLISFYQTWNTTIWEGVY